MWMGMKKILASPFRPNSSSVVPARRGQRGSTYAYSFTRTKLDEKRWAEQAEVAYRRLTEGWRKRGR